MSQPFIGQILGFGGNFAPRGWAFCEGQLLAIASHQALFSILGTTYGGDGRTTFALPDLRGRSMVQFGTGPGLSTIRLGQKGGAENHTMTVPEMPSHNHTATLHGETTIAHRSGPQGRMLAVTASDDPIYADTIAEDDKTMAPESIKVQNNGGNQAFSIRDPWLAVSLIIALEGIFPSRS